MHPSHPPLNLPLLCILLFHAFVTQTRVETGCDGWKANALTTRPTTQQGWQYGTVRSEFAYYVPRTLNRTVLTSRTITKKAYRTSVPYFLAKIEAYRTILPSLHWRIQKICWGDDKIYKQAQIVYNHKFKW